MRTLSFCGVVARRRLAHAASSCRRSGYSLAKLSPIRPIACESEEYIEITPRSCSTSSAAIVSARMRLSAKATSSGDGRVEVVADHQHVEVLGERVDGVRPGRVGRGGQHVRLAGDLDDVRARGRRRRPRCGRCGSSARRSRAIVSSTKPDSFSVSVWMATWTSYSSATRSEQSITAGVVPQSSWSFRPQAPASTCSISGAGRLALPLPSRPEFTGRPSTAWSIRPMFQGPGVQVVALVPSAGPVPPPIMRGDAVRERLVDLLRADHVDVGVDRRRAWRSGARRR